MNQDQLQKMHSGTGFIAALDQSGGSTPGLLKTYGVHEGQYSNEEEMFKIVHDMRARIMTAPTFSGEKILAAILFEDTMDRAVNGLPTAQYLWEERNIIPLLKVDKGLAEISDGAQMMKSMPELDSLLTKAKTAGIFGTKMRSFIANANSAGIAAVVSQQFEIAQQILAHGLVPIIEPEVDIHATDKAQIEAILKAEILKHLERQNQPIMLKLTLPEEDNFYAELVAHPKVLRFVALSGGYPQILALEKLSRNHGIIASFNRALGEGLNTEQSDEEFNSTIAASIDAIYQASIT